MIKTDLVRNSMNRNRIYFNWDPLKPTIVTILLFIIPLNPGNAVKKCKLFNYYFAICIESLDTGINFPINRYIDT